MCATLLLAACATQPVTPSAPWAQQAQTQAQAGHPAAAAAIYLRAAPSLPSPQREQIMLKAAALLLQAQQPEQARTVIEHINPQDLSSDDTGRRAGLAAQVALAEHQPAQALAALPTSTTGLSNPVAAELLELRAQAERLNDNPLGAVEARIARAPLLAETSALDANRKSLWELLSQASPQQTRQWLQQATTPPLKGWLALALIAKSTPPQPAALAAALANWQQQYNLPDATPIIEALKAQWQAMQVYPPRIAILLPLTGRFAPVSTAILDGLLTAYYRHPSQPDAQPITLRFYDTSAHPQNIPALYARAVRDGAQYVIGPLDRNAVTELAQSGAVSVPTLALNHAADGTQIPAKLYQFGLIPESEAAQAAERASLDGYSRAVALTPNSDWGKRVAAAFSNRFTQLGGQVLATGRYDPTASDFTPAIVNSLNIDYSDARRRAVAATIGQSVEFEARRRQDVDMIFIVGDPRQARLLIPQIRFHHGIGLPIYSISTAYSGTHDPRADHDLNGMIFDDAPLLLDAQGPAAAARDAMHTNFPDASRRYPRLIALGEDAFDVLPYLGRLASEDWARFPGLSGSLKMTPGNVLVRQLEWAQFDNGLPVPFGQVGTSNTVPTATPAQQNADTPP
ncbi:hypothetical protein BJI67_13430 [Acidihalobacter aeolianus]|uniref:LppC family lipoprotein n=2 Tax=Acidihalobacter aeolianus TaxID=2792603 RepID=A0A1D8KAG2_9GAMM|nr:hypothetical protein BJI67_13430 [Acidihalobacter aeolianus]